jgi:hypothetical protein
MKTKTAQQDNHLTANAPQSVVIAIMIHAHNTNTTTCLCYSCLTYYMQLGVVLYFFRGGGPRSYLRVRCPGMNFSPGSLSALYFR